MRKLQVIFSAPCLKFLESCSPSAVWECNPALRLSVYTEQKHNEMEHKSWTNTRRSLQLPFSIRIMNNWDFFQGLKKGRRGCGYHFVWKKALRWFHTLFCHCLAFWLRNCIRGPSSFHDCKRSVNTEPQQSQRFSDKRCAKSLQKINIQNYMGFNVEFLLEE